MASCSSPTLLMSTLIRERREWIRGGRANRGKGSWFVKILESRRCKRRKMMEMRMVGGFVSYWRITTQSCLWCTEIIIYIVTELSLTLHVNVEYTREYTCPQGYDATLHEYAMKYRPPKTPFLLVVNWHLAFFISLHLFFNCLFLIKLGTKKFHQFIDDFFIYTNLNQELFKREENGMK